MRGGVPTTEGLPCGTWSSVEAAGASEMDAELVDNPVSPQDQQELDACEAWVEKMVLLALAEEDQLSQ